LSEFVSFFFALKARLLGLKFKSVGRKISRGAMEKRPKNSKKYRKIALLSLFQVGPMGKKD